MKLYSADRSFVYAESPREFSAADNASEGLDFQVVLMRKLRVVRAAQSAPCIGLPCDWLKVLWVAARTVSASVVKVKPIGYWSDNQLIGKPMRLDELSCLQRHPEFAVSIPSAMSEPRPACVVPS